jgi:hypothetical protein
MTMFCSTKIPKHNFKLSLRPKRQEKSFFTPRPSRYTHAIPCHPLPFFQPIGNHRTPVAKLALVERSRPNARVLHTERAAPHFDTRVVSLSVRSGSGWAEGGCEQSLFE